MFRLRAPSAWRVIDVCLLLAASLVSTVVWFGYLPPWGTSAISVLVPMVFLRLVLLEIFELYDFEYHCSYFDIFYTLAGVMAGSVILQYLAQSLTLYWRVREGVAEDPYYDASLPAVQGLVGLAVTAAWRFGYLYIVRDVKRVQARIIIVGAGENGRSLKRDVEKYSSVVHRVVGFVDEPDHAGNEALLGRPTELARVVEDHGATDVIVTWHRTRLIEILDECARLRVRVRLMPDVAEVVLGQVSISQIAGVPLIEMKAFGRHGWMASAKRTFDLVVSGILIVPFTLVVVPIAALAIKLDSKGTVFFKQERVGMGGSLFRVVKFRTMIENAEALSGAVFATKDDPRVTRVGKFLRRTRLDELPQLFNVVKGEMSLVGPRPERPNFVREFSERFPSYPFRHIVRPGVTGLAQIYGRYDSSAEHKLRYDLAYINNLGFFLDLRILAKTVRRALTGSRAR